MASVKSKKKETDSAKSTLVYEVDPTECPFREFKDNELSPDLWGLGPAACRAAILMGKSVKPPIESVWIDEQTQPLPRSVRQYLHGWVRAEDLAADRWGAEVVVFEDNGAGKMSVMDIQLSHAQVLVRSSFCRRVLSACFMLERVDGLTVEHQWENFMCSYSEGWRARYHIYSPGVKPGGGQQHRPMLSKNGCYLVRLYYLGAWRCVWVNDQIPVDATDAPLLPFSPLLHTQPPKPGAKSAPAMVYANNVHLWPMLICKALLKLAAPNMTCDEDIDEVEDEQMPEFNVMHALSGCLDVTYNEFDHDSLWKLITAEILVFSWDDDDVTATSTVKSKPKKPTTKESREDRTRNTMATIQIKDTKDAPPYLLPGITPSHEMTLVVNMARDLPLKKPLPEPEVALWKYYRWVDWARRHGLYEAFDCPRTKFLKVNGLMKLSYAPHLLDVMSTESITYGFREEHEKTPPVRKAKLETSSAPRQTTTSMNQMAFLKEELREWIPFKTIYELTMKMNIIYFPSMFEYTTAASCPPVRVTKATPNKAVDIIAPKCGPLYLQIDSPEENTLRIALSMLHPRVMINSGIPMDEYMEPAYFILEKFEWFVDGDLPIAKAFVQTRGYDSVEVTFPPGRHYCRLWVHSRLHWHVMLLSQSTLLLGQRDVIQAAATHECPWATRFLNNLSNSFTIWIRQSRSSTAILMMDREFYKSYQPDLTWDREIVGYNQALLHWMFRQALQSLFKKHLPSYEYAAVCKVLRHFFLDPDFGLPPKPHPSRNLRDVIALDPCDCLMPDIEVGEEVEEFLEEELVAEEKPIVSPELMTKLLMPSTAPASQVCDLATEELPCGILKDEREKVISKQEAATLIQAHWRGSRARQCLNVKMNFSSDVLKIVMDTAFGNLEALSALMNEFFGMFPGAKTAYSVASALSGVNGLIQHQGTASVTPKCKWIPYFQGVFYCHAPVKAHFTVQSSIPHSTVMIYNNDTGLPLPQAYNAHITFDISPNINGYTVMGHGTLNESKNFQFDVHWQLTILSSRDGVFHVCDNDIDRCMEHPIPAAYKWHIDEIFVPNRRNILGGLLISVTKQEAITFRACASSPELELVATLRAISPDEENEEISTCHGKGEIYWPFISLQPLPPAESINPYAISGTGKKKSMGHMGDTPTMSSARSTLKSKEPTKKNFVPLSGKNKSITKMKPVVIEPKVYSIEVTAPSGWPLTLAQWKRVDEIRNTEATKRRESKDAAKKPAKQSGKGKEIPVTPTGPPPVLLPLPDDAHVELECSLAVGGGATARRDDTRDLQFAAARKLWDAKEPGRNLRGAQLRNEFREEFLLALPPPRSESVPTLLEETFGEELDFEEGEETMKENDVKQQGPTPATESGLIEMSMEVEEESKYLLMPDQLREKFTPLYFLPFCMKDKNEENVVLLTNDMAEAAKQDRHARTEASLERMKELQKFNEEHVLMRQRNRCRLLEQLFVDSNWCQELIDILEERNEAIAREQALQNLNANKKKLEQKEQQKTVKETKGKK